MAIRRTTTNGHNLLDEATALIEQHQAALADVAARVETRNDDISLRQVELEAEKKALGKVRQLVAG